MTNRDIIDYIALKLNEQDNQDFHEDQIARIFNEKYIQYLLETVKPFESSEQVKFILHPLVRFKEFTGTNIVKRSSLLPSPLRVLGILVNLTFTSCGKGEKEITRFASPLAIDHLGPSQENPATMSTKAYPKYMQYNFGSDENIEILLDEQALGIRVYYLASPAPLDINNPEGIIELDDLESQYKVINMTLAEMAKISENQFRYQTDNVT